MVRGEPRAPVCRAGGGGGGVCGVLPGGAVPRGPAVVTCWAAVRAGGETPLSPRCRVPPLPRSGTVRAAANPSTVKLTRAPPPRAAPPIAATPACAPAPPAGTTPASAPAPPVVDTPAAVPAPARVASSEPLHHTQLGAPSSWIRPRFLFCRCDWLARENAHQSSVRVAAKAPLHHAVLQ